MLFLCFSPCGVFRAHPQVAAFILRSASPITVTHPAQGRTFPNVFPFFPALAPPQGNARFRIHARCKDYKGNKPWSLSGQSALEPTYILTSVFPFQSPALMVELFLRGGVTLFPAETGFFSPLQLFVGCATSPSMLM